jgi:hypothetical protein
LVALFVIERDPVTIGAGDGKEQESAVDEIETSWRRYLEARGMPGIHV